MKKLMILCSLFLLVPLIINARFTRIDGDEVCTTTSCIEAASKIREKMDETVDPCDDFYTFSCGNFIKNTIILDDQVSMHEFQRLHNIVQEQTKAIISEPISENDIEPFKLLKKFYRACMNEDLIEERGLQPMLDIHDKMGGWPIFKGDEWDDSKWTWQQAIKDSRIHGFSTNYIFSFYVRNDFKNSTKRVIQIDQTSLGLNRKYLIKGLENEIVKEYYSYQVDMAVLFGADRTQADKEMREVSDFEFALANISKSVEERRNHSLFYNPITIRELQDKYPYNNWLDYFNSILPSESQVTENEIITIYDVSFFEKLGPLLERTPKRTLANYILLRMTRSSATFLTKELKEREYKFDAVITGRKTSKPRWKRCTESTAGYFDIAVGALYVRKYFKQSSKAVALQMVQSIKSTFEKILKTVSWLDEKTRQRALLKLKSLVEHVGFPDELMDDKKLIEYYKLFKVDENKFFETAFQTNVIFTNESLGKLRKPVNKTDWRTHSESNVVNAFYSFTENSIQIPAGILQGSFFSADRPKYLNYGSIGSVIGHEITHGFDDKGRQYDKDGNLINWWEEDTNKAFLKKARCIVEQFGNYTHPDVGLKLNGINTQGENIADNGGLKVAYYAYQSFVAINGVEPRLLGLNYTANQLFWIANAQTWCSVNRPERLKNSIIVGQHSPDRFRVFGQFKNLNEFSKDFNCPAESPMNPAEKCEVW